MIETDALVIGAGPIGLFQVFQLGLQGIHAHIVDVLGEPGGQCIELYPDKPIYDIPGVPRCTGRELTQRLAQQIAPFNPNFHFLQQVRDFKCNADGRWLVTTPQQQFLTRTVFIAAGVGAFAPKEIKVEGLAAFLGKQLFYRTAPPTRTADQVVVIVGGDDEAIANAVALAEDGPLKAKSISLVHRREVLQAHDDALARLKALRETGRVNFFAGQITEITIVEGSLCGVILSTPEDKTLKLPLDTLLVCMGVSPKLGPLADWGFAMERKQLAVDPSTFATSQVGVYAVGDINTYPGKKKLIVCGFHEATLAAFAAASYINPQASGALQYTTSSMLLQQRLGLMPE